MKSTTILYACALLSTSVCFGQKNSAANEKLVREVIATLSSDDMKGRHAMKPAVIEKSTAYLEKHFKDLKLEPLNGLQGYRQEIPKKKVALGSVVVEVDGKKVDASNVYVISDKANISYTHGLLVKSVEFDSTMKDLKQQYLMNAGKLMADTTSSIVFVDGRLREGFSVMQNFLKDRLSFGRPGNMIFVIGEKASTNYRVEVKQNLTEFKMVNLAGMIKGKSKPDEYVIFAAHYDHIGVLKPVNGDSIANGADDNASGVSAVVSLASYYSKQKNNERSIIFVAFTGEEQGMLGSAAFTKLVDPEKVVAMINIEMIGKPSKWGQNAAFMTGIEKSNLGEIMQKNLASTSYKIHPDPYPEQNLFLRSDNMHLANRGVPAHSFSTDQIGNDPLYHSVDDELSTIDMANVIATINAIATGSSTIVSGAETPTRIKK